jgi:tryptophan-rich sensory protein
MVVKFLVFLLINFFGLGLGGFFTGRGVSSNWYYELSKAPWTPPGWVFGVAWSLIMVCFSLYLSLIWKKTDVIPYFKMLFILSWFLNVLWNPLFFEFHWLGLAQVVIFVLLFVLVLMFLSSYKQYPLASSLLLPYVLWLVIANSLNFYIWLYN